MRPSIRVEASDKYCRCDLCAPGAEGERSNLQTYALQHDRNSAYGLFNLCPAHRRELAQILLAGLDAEANNGGQE